ncbi:MAG: glycosyltransferase family 4 protein [Parcubacteria group bacterium]|jgi:glycosyltransferase involved in cell wall biosynthesis
MKIFLLTRPVCPPWDEGSKNFAYMLAKNIRNAEIHLLTCGEVEDLPRSVIQHPIYSSPKWNFGQKMRAYLFLINEFFLKGGKEYDIFHSFFTPTRLNVFALKLCLRNKALKTIQTLATLRDDLYGKEGLRKIIHADLVITYSDYAKEKIREMGFPNVARIYPGIDLRLFSPAPKKKELMQKFETAEDDFVINYSGEYVRLGDMDDIIEVFSELAKENKNFKLHLAVRVKNEKDAKKREAVINKLKKENILKRVAFIDGGKYVMEDIYNLCDISIFPVRTMSGKFDIPLVVPEAMACGKPLIASNIPRLRYFLNDNSSILIDPGDRETLRKKIMYLYDNPEERKKISEEGMEFVRENFDIMKIVKEYEKVYENL